MTAAPNIQLLAELQPPPNGRITEKTVMRDGQWVTELRILWHDDKGWHDWPDRSHSPEPKAAI